MTMTRSPLRNTRHSIPVLAATTAAALPAVMLSSLALAQPASADTAPQHIPSMLQAAIKAQKAQTATVTSAQIPAASVSTAIPSLRQPARNAAPADYTVVRGDTVSAIAAKFGLETSAVLNRNNLQANSLIHPGQKLKISGGEASVAASAPATAGTYTVKAGDTMSAIAAGNGVGLAELLAANNLGSSALIFPGQKISLPGAAAVETEQDSSAIAPAASQTNPLVPSSFLGFTYPTAVVDSANQNKNLLNAAPVPSRDEMKSIIISTANRMGVEPSLALAFAFQESGFDQRAVSPANAIGTMQVIPSSGEWASDLTGRQINLLDPYDNVSAGIAIIRQLLATSKDLDNAIAGYYQGQYSVSTNGMFDDTLDYVAAIKAHKSTF